jgi:hypothetical protein
MVTEYVSRAWKIYKKNMSSFILSHLLVSFMTIVLVLMGIGIFFGSVLPILNWELVSSGASEDILREYFTRLFSDPVFLRKAAMGMGGFLLFAFLATLVGFYLTIGQYGMAYESLKRKTKLRTMFLVSSKLGLKWILTSALMILGMIVLVIFGILTLGLGFLLVPFLIPILTLIAPSMVVENNSPTQTIKRAFKVGMRNYLTLFVLCLIYAAISGLIVFIGNLFYVIPIIGIFMGFATNLILGLVLSPVIKISFVQYYLKNKKR